ncbi:MAG: hypothetical protein JNM75_04970 [Rhodospirillales bacterium]|nr:hypothetical protein [Rhodospirillales bacterium]
MTDHRSEIFPYALWVEDALRGVVRRTLAYAADHGLPGDHHFYISFRTTDAGVHIADHLRARYPSEMTIVLQHQFWDLEVGGEAFSVSLRFGGKLTPLRVPFAAITAFGDPSVNFGLQFSAPSDEPVDSDPAAPVSPESPAQPPAEGEAEGRVIAFDAFRKK